MSTFGDRLKLQLTNDGLSSAQFADELGVNRSGVSHLINGRNNPGLDLMQRIRMKYPDWDHNWLFFNEKRQKNKAQNESTGNQNRNFQDQQSNYQSKNTIGVQTSLFSDERVSRVDNESVRLKRIPIKTILIYSDGTFEIFSRGNNLLE